MLFAAFSRLSVRSLRLLNRPALYPILRGLATQTTSKPGMDATRFKRGPEDRRLHDFSVQTLDGSIVSLSEFRHAPVALIVNTASEDMACDRNYQELQQLYDKYKDNGFVVLAFPCNQFFGEEPLSDSQLAQHVKGKGITFPFFAKVNVNGADAHPLFAWLKESAHGTLVDAVKWNFTKFLVVDGVPVKRYGPTEAPLSIEHDIAQAIRETNADGGMLKNEDSFDNENPQHRAVQEEPAVPNRMRSRQEAVGDNAQYSQASVDRLRNDVSRRMSAQTDERSTEGFDQTYSSEGLEPVDGEAMESQRDVGKQAKPQGWGDAIKEKISNVVGVLKGKGDEAREQAEKATDSAKEFARGVASDATSDAVLKSSSFKDQSLTEKGAKVVGKQAAKMGAKKGLKEAASSMTENAKEKVEDAWEAGKEMVESAKDKMEDAASGAVSKGKRAVKSVQAAAKEAVDEIKGKSSDIREGAWNAVGNIKKGASSATEKTRELAEDAAQEGQRMAKAARENVNAATQEGFEKAKEKAKDVQRSVREAGDEARSTVFGKQGVEQGTSGYYARQALKEPSGNAAAAVASEDIDDYMTADSRTSEDALYRSRNVGVQMRERQAVAKSIDEKLKDAIADSLQSAADSIKGAGQKVLEKAEEQGNKKK